jgi:hypothetical protein
MCRPGRLVLVLALSVLLVLPHASGAWGFEAHRYIMARAIPLLPDEIRPFFEKYQPAIVEHVIDPDLWRTAGWEAESPRHYLDLDAYGPYPFTALPRDYEEAVKKHGQEFLTKNGLIPWRTAEVYGKLVEAFTQKAGYSRENIKFFSSVLTHYVSDAHVPFHAVLNHDGQLTGQWGIHSRFESELFERYLPQLRVDPKPIGPVPPARDLVFDTLLASFSLTQTVLDADKAAVAGRDVYDDAYFEEFFRKAQPILERRLSEAITASASLITAAWNEAGRPALPVEGPRTPRPVRRQ